MGMKVMKLPISFGAPKSTSADDDNNFFKTLNSVYFDSIEEARVDDDDDDDDDDVDDVESIIRGAHMESRLFFEPSTAKSLHYSNETSGGLDCVALALESEDPYGDFRRSMEEVAAVIKKGDWGCLEDLLAWYLRVNAKNNHAYIIAAFVDLLLKISSDENSSNHLNDSSNNSSTNTSSRKSSSSSCVSGELVLQPGGKSSSASCFSSSSPSTSSLSQEQEKLIKLI